MNTNPLTFSSFKMYEDLETRLVGYSQRRKSDRLFDFREVRYFTTLYMEVVTLYIFQD
jgi:hypothetical protein